MKNRTTTWSFYEEFFNQLQELTVHQLIERFNREVGVRGWTSSRGAFLTALRDVFELHPYHLDPDIFQYGATSFAQKIELCGDTITSIKKQSNSG